MGRQKHLILALNTQGLGEAILGARLAADLQKAGDEVFFLAHDSNAKVLAKDFPCLTFSSDAAPLLPFYLSDCLNTCHPSSIILSDFLTTAFFLEGLGKGSHLVTSLNLPMFAIDIWDSSKTPDRIDLFVGGSDKNIPRWDGEIKYICPVPFLLPHSASEFYRCLPERTAFAEQTRQQIRAELGLGSSSKAVLLCTAEWQHPGLHPVGIREGSEQEKQWANGKRVAELVPLLVSDYLSRLGEDVHLVHVGPQAYDLKEHLDGRYHWMASLAPAKFDQLLAAMDLLLSANISATTIAKAMVYEVPVLVLQNSVSAASREEAEASLPEPASQAMREWLEKVVPLFPFALWPLGYHRFLAPLLRDNPYVAALQMVELLHEGEVEAALSALLFDSAARENQAHRQANYLAQVRALPTGAQLIQACLAD
jgi:hypothetical protein